jgi:hypothetical protein
MKSGMDLTSVRQDLMAGFYDDGDEPSDSINAGNFLPRRVTTHSSGTMTLNTDYTILFVYIDVKIYLLA